MAHFKDNVLSDVPSKILIQAMKDLEAVERLSRFKINMGDWLEPKEVTESGKCEVCHAGAVMINSLGASGKRSVSPWYYSSKTSSKLTFINHVRVGKISLALGELAQENIISFEKVEELEEKYGEDVEIRNFGYPTKVVRRINFRVPDPVAFYREGYEQEYKDYIQTIISWLQAEGL